MRDAEAGALAWIDRDITGPMGDFQDPKQEWRRLFSELYGTFLLVLVAAGGGMMSQAFPDTISRTAAVVAPGLMVMGIILFMGKVSGAHLNPAVSVAFSLRGDFPWRRVPGYIVVQLIGATLAALVPARGDRRLRDVRVELPGERLLGWPGASGWRRCSRSALVSVILGTASGAQNIGIIGAFGVGGYIALAGLWGSPISGTSMNPARTFGPDLVGGNFTDYWVYVAGPLTGAVLAVGIAFVLRGPGGGAPAPPPRRATCSPRSRRPDQTYDDPLETLMSADRSHAMDHVVVVLFENRSLDNVLGHLYGPEDGKTFEGVIGKDLTNPIPEWAEHGADRKVVPYTVATDMDSPNPDSGEEYPHTNTQLFNILNEHNRFKIGDGIGAPYNAPAPGQTPTMDGFVTDYISTFTGEIGRQPTYEEYAQIMTGFTPEQVPVLNGLARGFGVFDHWFCEVPSQTLHEPVVLDRGHVVGVTWGTRPAQEVHQEQQRRDDLQPARRARQDVEGLRQRADAGVLRPG